MDNPGVVQPMLEEGREVEECKKTPQFVIATIACIGAMLAGTGIAWSSPALYELEHDNEYVQVTKEQGSWISSLLAIGACAGAPLSGMLVDRIGRKWTALALSIPFLTSSAMIVFINSVPWLYVARIIAGLGTGGACVAIPIYISEISQESLRGIIGSFFQLFLTTGILLIFIIGAYVNYKVMTTVIGTMTILFALVFFFCAPETPVYLMKKGRREDAKRALYQLRGRRCNAEKVLKEMQTDSEAGVNGKVSMKQLFTDRVTVFGLIAALGLMAMQQLSGINAVMFYTVTIFDSAGSDLDAAVCSIIVAAVQVVTSLVAVALIEKVRRKTLLYTSSSVMAVCLAALGFFFKLKQSNADVSSLGWLPLTSMVLFIVAFCIAYGPIPWMMMAELFSADVKGVASSLTVVTSWSFVFLVTKVFPTMRENLGGDVTFWIFAGWMVLAGVFVRFLVPETKDKTLAEVHEKLRRR